jgi:glycosyltransferase involved in cell wall biosynthesis
MASDARQDQGNKGGGAGPERGKDVQMSATAARPTQIAFYAPLKSPDHPVPSGDRLMARQLCTALSAGGAEVVLASSLRSYLPDPADQTAADQMAVAAEAEVARLAADWDRSAPPRLWLCYHPYYKSPDLIGPPLCRRFGLPYVTIESSWSARRNSGIWAETQGKVLDGLHQAALNICLTRRDQAGIAAAAPDAATALLAPFIDPAPFLALEPTPDPGRLVTVAMMRPGDKVASYRFLAQALALVDDLPWRLSVIGDGPARPQVEADLGPYAARIDWLGALPQTDIAKALAHAQIYVWPGCGEAYGLAYLEAQAAGLPVLACATAGVPEVVANGETGLLTPAGDVPAYAAALRRLLTDASLCKALAVKTRPHILARHSLTAATQRLATLLAPLLEPS